MERETVVKEEMEKSSYLERFLNPQRDILGNSICLFVYLLLFFVFCFVFFNIVYCYLFIVNLFTIFTLIYLININIGKYKCTY